MSDAVPTIADAAERIARRALSPVELVKACLERIEALDARIRAWVVVDGDRALDLAKRSETELVSGRYRGPLHGIPIGIKDIVAVEGFPTRLGLDEPCRSRAGSPAGAWERGAVRESAGGPGDATLVRRLREGGAIVLGKTVTTAYASFDPPPTRNPWNPERTPGGSSSGSAAAVAAGMCLGAIGSQTGGSITRPASFCGVVGVKPTYGRVSAAGVFPLAFSMDHPGPIAQSVEDAAVLLAAVAGYDPGDPLSEDRPADDYAAAVRQQRQATLVGARPVIGWVRGFFDRRADAVVRAATHGAVERLRTGSTRGGAAAGFDVREIELRVPLEDVLASHRTIMAVEAAALHRQRYECEPEHFPPHIRQLVEEGLATECTRYADARRHQLQFRREMLACFAGVGALLTPATVTPAPDTSTTGDPAFNSPWSFCGFPTVNLPVSLSPDRLPCGVQLIGRPWCEAELLGIAARCEAAFGFRARPPRYDRQRATSGSAD